MRLLRVRCASALRALSLPRERKRWCSRSMSVSSSHVMGGACTWIASRTITQDMNGLCRSRHFSARLANAIPDLRLRDRGELEMPDDAGLVNEEGARKAEHAVAARRRTVAVEDRLKAIEPERVEEGP